MIKSDLIWFQIDSELNVALELSGVFMALLVAFIFIFFVAKYCISGRRSSTFEIAEAEFGIGDQKILLKPNNIDRQIAYQIWVELSTRKIGLPIDLEADVISEIYDSWYSFFSVTRDLIKDIPATKFRRKDTEKIVKLSIDILNEGLRPHLTSWQAKFRRWYERQIKCDEYCDESPQEIQLRYPMIEPLKKDLLAVNKRLISYREKMYCIVCS